MKKYALVFVLALSGCVTSNIPKQADMKSYVDNLQFRPQESEMQHEEYGKVHMNEEPLLSIHKSCIKKAYEGISVTLSGVVVSDPILLSEMEKDKNTYDIMRGLGFRMNRASNPVKANHYAVMRDPAFKEAVKVLDPASKKVRECFKQEGWTFPDVDKLTNRSN